MTKIITPPCVTSRREFNFGQAINFIYADVIARYYHAKEGHVEFVPYSWNNHARRTEELNPDFKTYKEHLAESSHRVRRLEEHLRRLKVLEPSSRYEDSDPRMQEFVIEGLQKLIDDKYIYATEGDLYLDLPKIVQSTSLVDFLNDANFVPNRYKNLVAHNLKNNAPFQLTQDAVFATSLDELDIEGLNPTRKLKPVVNLYFAPLLLNSDSADYLVNGECSTTRFVYDGFAIHSALLNQPLARNVLIYPLLTFDPAEGAISALLDKWGNPDIIRYAALQKVNSTERSELSEESFRRGKKLINKLVNLKRCFLDVPASEHMLDSVSDLIEKGLVTAATHKLEQEARKISSEITERRSSNDVWNTEEMRNRFGMILASANVFFPGFSQS